jgi:hypothetical protein
MHAVPIPPMLMHCAPFQSRVVSSGILLVLSPAVSLGLPSQHSLPPSGEDTRIGSLSFGNNRVPHRKSKQTTQALCEACADRPSACQMPRDARDLLCDLDPPQLSRMADARTIGSTQWACTDSKCDTK